MRGTFDSVILTYHSISSGPAPLCIAPDAFAAQMSWLTANANVVPLTDIVRSLTQGLHLPSRAVALTFDDGFADFYSEAAPILKRLELPAIVFLPAGYCGRAASWDRHAGGRPLMMWNQIRELVGHGVSFGSHSMTHPVLPGLTDEELKHEIAESKTLIESETGQEVRFFCYPYGCYDKGISEAASTFYGCGACTTDLRMLCGREDRFALPRIDMHYLRNLAVFRTLFTEPFRLYIYARRMTRNFVSCAGLGGKS